MAYTRVWSTIRPDGASVLANTLDSEIQYVRKDLEERIAGIFGLSSGEFAADPIVPKTLTLTGAVSFQTINFGLGTTTGNNTFGDPSNKESVAIGQGALQLNTTGTRNVVVGYVGLYNNTTGSFNTTGGYEALFSNTTGTDNTTWGYAALKYNTIGIDNVAIGSQASHNNTAGSGNISIGRNALYANTVGTYSIGIGSWALQSAITAVGYNIAIGRYALQALLAGQGNTCVGDAVAFSMTGGSSNTALGAGALYSNLTGSSNVAIGRMAGAYELGSNTFYLDNQDRTNTAGDKAKALMYGTFDAVAANQTLAINAAVSILGVVSQGGSYTSKGVQNLTTGVAKTMFAITNAGTYFIGYTYLANGGPQARGTAIVIHDAINPVIVTQANGAIVVSSISGSNFQVTQSSGTTVDIYYTYTYLPF